MKASRRCVSSVALTGCVLLACLSVALGDRNFDDNAWQYWEGTQWRVKLNESWELELQQELRFGPGADWFYQGSQVALRYKATPWLVVAPSFKTSGRTSRTQMRGTRTMSRGISWIWNSGGGCCTSTGASARE